MLKGGYSDYNELFEMEDVHETPSAGVINGGSKQGGMTTPDCVEEFDSDTEELDQTKIKLTKDFDKVRTSEELKQLFENASKESEKKEAERLGSSCFAARPSYRKNPNEQGMLTHFRTSSAPASKSAIDDVARPIGAPPKKTSTNTLKN